MKVTVVPGRQLTAEHVSAWSAFQSADPSSDSPFLSPAFVQAVAEVRDDVEVAVIEDHGSPAGFFPYQRRPGNVGRPVGGPMSDFQGLALRPGLHVDADELIRSCELTAWHFDHLVAAQTAFRPYSWFFDESPYIDTSRGFDAYCEERRRSGSKTVRKTFQKLRKLAREVGNVRFEFGVKTPQLLRELIAWKSTQCREARVFNVFLPEWTRELLRNLLDRNTIDVAGNLSALYVGDELQAAFYGLRSNHVLHLWCVAYGPNMAKYSPGYQLLIKLIQAAPSYGIQRIDLGRGSERFKGSFATGATTLAEGSIDSRIGRRTARRLWHSSRHWVGCSRLRRPVLPAWRLIKRARDNVHFR